MAETTGTDWQQIKSAARHGTQAKGQASDGTGTSGNLAKYNADGSLTDSGVAAASLSSPPFVFGGYMPGVPAASAYLPFDMPGDISPSYPANFANSTGKCGTNPTSTVTVDVQDNGSSIGSISVSTSGVVTFVTTGGVGGTITAGHEVQAVFPATPDATFADFRFTMRWSR
jgi:hypothetical protein